MPKSRHAHNALPNSVGELELLVMETIWQQPGIDARTISVELASGRDSSLSTVQSTLERLVRKKLLRREKQGHAYRYYASQTRGDLLGTMLKDVIQLLHDGSADTILSSFVNVAAKLDDNALDELELLIRKKRQQTNAAEGAMLMIDTLTFAGSFATVWLTNWLLCLFLLLIFYQLLRQRILKWHPAVAASILLASLVCPFLLSLGSTLLLFAPVTEAALVSSHCHNTCQTHAPIVDAPWLAETGLILSLLIVFVMLRELLGNLRSSRQLNCRLALLASDRGEYQLLTDARPFVFTLGWWRNRIYLTTGLLQRCTDRELKIMLAHEQAHVQRRDNVRLLLARLFLLPLPERFRQKIYGDLHCLVESSCDFLAARSFGATQVAEALLNMQRLLPNHWDIGEANVSSAFNGSEVESRIHALLDYRQLPSWQQWGLHVALVLILLISFVIVDPLHHSIEFLMGLY